MTDLFSKHSIKQYFKFIIVGGIGVVINLTILFLLTEFLGIYYIVSEIIAFITAIIHNYSINKIWTFKERLKDESLKKFSQYFLISLIGLVINLIVLYFLVEFFHIWYIIAELFATTISSIVNFYGNKFWTFKDKKADV